MTSTFEMGYEAGYAKGHDELTAEAISHDEFLTERICNLVTERDAALAEVAVLQAQIEGRGTMTQTKDDLDDILSDFLVKYVEHRLEDAEGYMGSTTWDWLSNVLDKCSREELFAFVINTLQGIEWPGVVMRPAVPSAGKDERPGANPVWCGLARAHRPHELAPGASWCGGYLAHFFVPIRANESLGCDPEAPHHGEQSPYEASGSPSGSSVGPTDAGTPEGDTASERQGRSLHAALEPSGDSDDDVETAAPVGWVGLIVTGSGAKEWRFIHADVVGTGRPWERDFFPVYAAPDSAPIAVTLTEDEARWLRSITHSWLKWTGDKWADRQSGRVYKKLLAALDSQTEAVELPEVIPDSWWAR